MSRDPGKTRKRDRLFELASRHRSSSPQAPPILPAAISTRPQQSSSTVPNIAVTPTANSSTLARPPPSAPANRALSDAINKHLDSLSAAEQDTFRAASTSLTEENILDKVRSCDQAHVDSSIFRKRAGEVEGVLRILDKFMAGIAIAIQANPDISAIAVGAVRVVLDVAIGFLSFFARLSQMLCRFGDFLAPLAEYARLSLEKTVVQDALAAVYGDLLRFLQKAHAVFVDHRGKQRTMTSFRIFWRVQWMPFEDEFGRIESDLNHHLNVLQHSSSAINLTTDLETRSQQQIQMRREFLDWLSTYPYEERHQTIHDQKHLGTGEWLLMVPEFQTWFNSARSALLWCHGGPGAGKSVLASNVIEHITRERGLVQGVGIAFVYYDYQQQRDNNQNLQHVICALLKQLCRGLKDLPDHLVKAHQDSQAPTVVGNCEDFVAVAAKYGEVFIVVDALDECAEEQLHRNKMIRFLDEIRKSLESVKIFITSRREPDIVSAFNNAGTPMVLIEAKNTAPDIERYVKDEVQQLRQGRHGIQLYVSSEALAEEIVRTLVDKADGMFLWVRLQLESLCRESVSQRDSEVRKALGALPNGLNATYTRILEHIEAKPPYLRNLALKTLRWVLYARRILTTTELRHAVANLESDPYAEHVGVDDLNTILEACAGLVVVLPVIWYRGGRVQLMHYSVQEFFTSRDRKLSTSLFAQSLNSAQEIHEVLASTCISLLGHDDMRSGPCHNVYEFNSRLFEQPFIWYAATYFDLHTALSGKLSARLGSQIDDLLSCNEDLVRSILQARAVPAINRNGNLLPDSHVDFQQFQGSLPAGALVYATRLLEVDELETWRSDDSIPQFALHYACMSGSQTAVQRFLRSGIHPNTKDENGMTALYFAAKGGYNELVRMLLDNGTDVNAYGGKSRKTVLQAASWWGHEVIVQMLLDSGADVNAQGGEWSGALQAASYSGHEVIVQMLLDSGADVNAQGGEWSSALQVASSWGHEVIVQMLLDSGADVNAQGGEWSSALQAASYNGHEIIVQMLLDSGADVNAQGKHFGNALQAASSGRGYAMIVQMLLAKGADVNA